MPTSSFATAALEAALRALRLIGAPGEPELIRVGSAAVLTTSDLVLRVTRDTPQEEVRRMLSIANHLNERGVTSVKPARITPVEPSPGTLVTVWEREQVFDRRPSPAEHGRVLALLHACPVPSWLPAFEPLARTGQRLRNLSAATQADSSVIAEGFERAQQLWADAQYPQISLVHGDIPGNLLATDHGAVLCDFENTGAGNAAFDLARVLHAADRFAWPEGDLQQLLDAYLTGGGAPRNIAQGRQLVDIVDVVGAAWAVMGSLTDPERFAGEAAVRVETVRSGGRVGGWRPL